MRTEKYLLLALCLFILGTFISACGGGGNTTPPSDSLVYYYLLAQQNNNQQNNNQEQQNDPTLPTLEVSPTEFNLFIEEEAKVKVTLNGEDVTDKVTYKSDEELIAIAEKGVVKAKYIEGTAKITVSLERANSATFTINVKDDSTPVTLDVTVFNQLHEIETIEKSYADRKYLKEIDIPATFTYEGTKYKIISIDYRLFSNCDSLKKVTLPDSLETISQLAFENCSSLEEMTIRDDIVCIFPSAFLNCSNLTKLTTKTGKEINIPESNIETVENVTFIGVKSDFSNVYQTITNITIPNGLTKIPNRAFDFCTSLENVIIPQSIKNIGYGSFNLCSSLTELIVPDNVITIEGKAFMDCTLLKSVTIGNGVTTIGRYAFYECTSLENITIGNSVTTIEEEAFCYSKIKSITIPDSVISIGRNAFNPCSSLESVTIGKSVTTIEYCAFENCTLLKSVTIPNSVKTIERGAFANCTNSGLTIDISTSSVTSIGDNAFYNVNNIKINEEQNLLDDGQHWGAKNVTIVNS